MGSVFMKSNTDSSNLHLLKAFAELVQSCERLYTHFHESDEYLNHHRSYFSKDKLQNLVEQRLSKTLTVNGEELNYTFNLLWRSQFLWSMGELLLLLFSTAKSANLYHVYFCSFLINTAKPFERYNPPSSWYRSPFFPSMIEHLLALCSSEDNEVKLKDVCIKALFDSVVVPAFQRSLMSHVGSSADNIYNLSITLINVVGRCYREHRIIHAIPLLMAFLKYSYPYLTHVFAPYSSVFELAIKYYPDEISNDNIGDHVEVALYFLDRVDPNFIKENVSKLKYNRFWSSIIKLYMCVMTAHVKCEQCAAARDQGRYNEIGTSNNEDFAENLLSPGDLSIINNLDVAVANSFWYFISQEEQVKLKRSFEELTGEKMMNLLESNDYIGVIKPMKAHQVHQEEYAFFNAIWKKRFRKYICLYKRLNQVLLNLLPQLPLHVERMIFKLLSDELHKNKSECGEIQPHHLNNDLVKYFMSQSHQYCRIIPERTETY